MTKVVRKLEDEFGLQLVERGGSLLALTPAGRTLYQRAIELATLADATRRDMAGEVAALRGTIRLGVVPALLNSVAIPVLADVLKESAAVQVQLSIKHSAELVRLVEEGKLDLALAFGVQMVPPDVGCTLVGRQHYRLVVRAGHPLAGQAPDKAALSRLPWLLPTPDVAIRVAIDRLFADAALGPLNIRVEADTSATLLIPLLRGSDLVAVMAEQAFQPIAAEGLAVLDVALDALVGDVGLYHRHRTPAGGLLAQVKHRLEAQARSNFCPG